MKRLLLLVLLLMLSLHHAFSMHLQIEVVNAGDLKNQINCPLNEVDSLIVSGKLNGTDIAVIRNMSGLKVLNMEKAHIVSGGSAYYKSHTTSENEIGDNFFEYITNLEKVVLPNSVTSIGSEAFYDCSELISVTLPDHVTSIGSGAFYDCSRLTSVVIPNGVTSIGDAAFSGCSGLTSVRIPNSVTSFGDGVFSHCSGLTSATIGDGVTTLDGTFSGCSGLTSVTIGNGVTTIESETFTDCSSLTSVVIPNSVTSIGTYAFSGCSGLTSVLLEDGVDTLTFSSSRTGTTPFYDCPIATLYMGRNILNSPFKNRIKLTSLTIGNNVTSIIGDIFSNCSNLKSITIGNHVTTIDSTAFAGCKGYKMISHASAPPLLNGRLNAASLEVPVNSACRYARSDNWKDIDCIYAVADDRKLYPVLVNQNGNKVVTINNSIKDLEVEENTTLTVSPKESVDEVFFISVRGREITQTLIKAGSYAFTASIYHKDNHVTTEAYPVTSVTLATAGSLIDVVGTDSVEKINYLKLNGNVNGTDILTIRKMINLRLLDLRCANIINGGHSYYKNYVTSSHQIGDYFFKDKTNLYKVLLPLNITHIGSYAFSGMTNLKSIFIPDRVIYIGDGAFSGCSGLTSLIIPDSVFSIGDGAFSGCGELASVVLEDGAKTLDFKSLPFNGCPITQLYVGRNLSYYGMYSPFKNKTKLTSLTIGNKVTSISGGAFKGCSGLTSVTIPNSVTFIDHGAFSDCSELTSLLIEDGTDSLEFNGWAFENCPIATLHLGRSITSTSDSQFENKTTLKSLTLGNRVISIGSRAFKGCSRLTSANIPNSVTSISSSAFSDCSGLTSVILPNSITSIGHDAFSGCSGLTSVILPDSITTIGNDVFRGCSGLTSVILPNSIASIGHDAFSGCSRLRSIIIPNKVTSIGACAFSGCSELTSVILPNSITSIGDAAFSGCSGLTSVILPNSITSIDDDTFNDCSGLASVIIPNSVISIGARAFMDCSGLASVSIPNSVTSIGYGAFSGCDELTSVSIPNSITYLGNDAFADCRGLSSLKFEDGTKPLHLYYRRPFGHCPITSLHLGRNIDYYTMGSSSSPDYSPFNKTTLTTVIVGDSVTAINHYAFYGCTNIDSVTSLNTTPPAISENTFSEETYNTASLCVRKGCKTIYWLQPYWEKFFNIIELNDDVTGLSPISPNNQRKGNDVYTLDGKKLNVTSESDLPKGIYIIGGKKRLIR